LAHLLKSSYTNNQTPGKLSELNIFWCWWMSWQRTWRLLSYGLWYHAVW
jgi:hypothetical protein